MTLTLALCAALLAQPQDADPKVLEADVLLQKLGGPLAERRAATTRLIELRRASTHVFNFLCDKAQTVRDPVVRARLHYILGALFIRAAWTRDNAGLPGFHFGGDDAATIVYLDVNSRITFLDAGSGKQVVQTTPSAPFLRPPIVAGQTVFLPLDYGNGPMLRVLNLDDPKDVVTRRGLANWAVARIGDHVGLLLSGKLSSISTLEPKKSEWEVAVKDAEGMAAAGDRFVWADSKGKLTAVESATGVKSWEAEGPARARLLGAPDALITSTNQGFQAFAADSGKRLWSRDMPNVFSAAIGRYVVFSDGVETGCLEASTGARLWTRTQNQPVAMRLQPMRGLPPPALVNKHMVVTVDNKLQFVNLTSGLVEGEFEVEPQIHGLIVTDRFVLVFHGRSKLTALRVAD